MSQTIVEFCTHQFSDEASAFVDEALECGALSGPGRFTMACEKEMSLRMVGASAFLVPSCTAALEMAAILADIGSGDEVIMPSYTFVSTANAVVLRGATPVFVDIDPITLNMEPRAVEAAVSPRTKAIFVVHYAGVPAEMSALLRIARSYGLVIIEDAAQAYGSYRDNTAAGTFASLACFSFHHTKNISAGEAGALIVNDATLAERASIIREKGTDRVKFQKGEVSAYSWQDIGSSYVVNEITAALLYSQLLIEKDLIKKRIQYWTRYCDGLKDLHHAEKIQIPNPPATVRHNGHIFFVVLPSRALRDNLKNFLWSHGIRAVTHYEPLHLSPAGRKYGRTSGDLANTERAGACLLRLPLHNSLGDKVDLVIDRVRSWCSTSL